MSECQFDVKADASRVKTPKLTHYQIPPARCSCIAAAARIEQEQSWRAIASLTIIGKRQGLAEAKTFE